MNDKNPKYIRSAAITAIVGNIILVILKIVVGIISKSGAMVGDGIDSSADVLIGVVTLVVVGIMTKPADVNHPWGHRRAEAMATVFLSFVIFFAGAQLIVASISNLFMGVRNVEHSTVAIIATIVSIIGKVLLALNQYILGKRADSAMIKANAKNMAGDILTSSSVLIGLVISEFMESAYADTIIAILIGAWIIKTSVSIFLEANLELMDGNENMKPYRVIVEAVEATEGASNPHHARIRRIGGFWDIDFDIGVDPNCSVLEAHSIATNVEAEIKNRLENVFDIMIHIEPCGDDSDETFGLSEEEMRSVK